MRPGGGRRDGEVPVPTAKLEQFVVHAVVYHSVVPAALAGSRKNSLGSVNGRVVVVGCGVREASSSKDDVTVVGIVDHGRVLVCAKASAAIARYRPLPSGCPLAHSRPIPRF